MYLYNSCLRGETSLQSTSLTYGFPSSHFYRDFADTNSLQS